MKWKPFGVLALLLPAMGAWLLGAAPGAAQEADDEGGRTLSAGIYAGTCDSFEAEPRFALSELSGGQDDDADDRGNGAFTEVAAPIDTLLGEPHVIAVSSDDDGSALACGEITGNYLGDGGLAVGLVERGGSGLTGLAYLSTASETTGVSLFLASGLVQADDDGSGSDDEAVDGDLSQANVTVFNGTCDARGADAVLTFSNFNTSDDDDVGVSVTTAPVAANQVGDDDLSAVVSFGDDEGTCGQLVTGPAGADDVAVVGLREQDDSDLTGFIVFETDDDDTVATLFLAEDLGEDDAAQQESAEVAAADDDDGGASAGGDDDGTGDDDGGVAVGGDDDGAGDDDGGVGAGGDDDGGDDDGSGGGTGGGTGGDDDDGGGGDDGGGDDGGGDDDGGDD